MARPKFQFHNWLFGAFLILFFLAGFTPAVQSVNLKIADLLAQKHFAHPDVVILAIDDKSISAIGRWPWPRAIEAKVLSLLGEDSPQAVGVDINFSEPEDRVNDAVLAMVVQMAKFPIVFPLETIRMSDGSAYDLGSLPALTSSTYVS